MILAKFALYRTYHGCAMNPAIQAATIAAWNDEAHVAENRHLYAEKFAKVIALLAPLLPVSKPGCRFLPVAEDAHRCFNADARA